jgi:hypothetical protein
LAEKTRLIARGLMFAHSQSARNQIEKLLTELTAPPQRQAPALPVYRLEGDDELPRTFPVAGTFPLPSSVFASVPKIEGSGAFHITHSNWSGDWVSLPGWKVITAAEEPIGIIAPRDSLPFQISAQSQEMIVVLDRGITVWDEFHYFAIDRDGQLGIEWFDAAPSIPLLGKLVLIIHPKRAIEPGNPQDLWDMED